MWLFNFFYYFFFVFTIFCAVCSESDNYALCKNSCLHLHSKIGTNKLIVELLNEKRGEAKTGDFWDIDLVLRQNGKNKNS